MGKMIDIDSFHKRYMLHATNKAEAEFNQIISEIKKTESISKDGKYNSIKNNSIEIAIEDTKMHLYMQESYAIGKDYIALENALDIIRKYEKIEKIVKSWNDMNSFDSMKQISEVIEDAD
ncbi:MAG: hypothetical protein IKR19_08340 [Acholeplasmatales bacterium]|nr:hypothetical protein [Acholeplasmatales bacterium]